MSDIATWLKDYSSLVAIPVAALVAALTYSWQKFADRKSALVELRRKVYIDYLNAFFRVVENSTPENNTNHNLRLMDLSTIASDEVVFRVGVMKVNIMDQSSIDRSRMDVTMMRSLVADVIIAMRKDCFEHTNLTPPQIMIVTPFRP